MMKLQHRRIQQPTIHTTPTLCFFYEGFMSTLSALTFTNQLFLSIFVGTHGLQDHGDQSRPDATK